MKALVKIKDRIKSFHHQGVKRSGFISAEVKNNITSHSLRYLFCAVALYGPGITFNTVFPCGLPVLYQPKMLKATVSPASTTETIDISLISILRAGPEVSLNGSPTVSPTTVAL